jgi:nuclear transport factor 2 (NTF2) superfamily protein
MHVREDVLEGGDRDEGDRRASQTHYRAWTNRHAKPGDTEIELSVLLLSCTLIVERRKRRTEVCSGAARIRVVRPPLPPFDEESARQKVKMAQDAWNTRDPEKVALAYTEDSKWRNREEFFEGREAIRDFLKRKWARELDYRLEKNLWCFTDNRIAVRFEYESHDKDGQWWRSHGNELWEFDENGLMRRRDASINDYKIEESERKFRWTR